jgi:hypothetical protein
MMRTAIEHGEVSIISIDAKGSLSSEVGKRLLKWIDAYSKASGDARSCWVGAKKKLACITWMDADDSGDEDEIED